MKKIIFVLLLAALCTAAICADFTAQDGSVKLSAKTISMTKTTVTAKTGADLKATDKDTSLIVRSDSLKLVYGGKELKGIESLKQAVITDNVYMEYTADGNTFRIWCSSAFYENSIMTLAGDVKIEYPAESGLMTCTGNRATVNLSKNLADDQQLFSIEGDSERAKITVPAGGAVK